MKHFAKTASAVVLTAALWTGISYSHALLVRAAAEEAVAVSGSDLAPVDREDGYNVVAGKTYAASSTQEETETAVLAETTVTLTITRQPSDYSGEAGSQATFRVKAQGDGLSYQWQLSDDGTTWRNSSVKTDTYAATLTEKNNGRCVRCIVSDSAGRSVTSQSARMKIAGLFAITRQPADYSGQAGSQARFKVEAEGSGLRWQWQLSDDGTTWRNSSTTNAEYVATLSEKNNGRKVRCVVTDGSGATLTSNAAAMRIEGLLAITKQSVNCSGALGDRVSFRTEASGTGLTWQWQLSDDGVNWRNSSATTAEYVTTLSEKNNGRRVRCVVTDVSGSSVTSNAATMRVEGLLSITGQPSDYEGAVGDRVSFKTQASGTGLTYQWQLSEDGENWRNSSTKSAEYTATLSNANNGRRVRCVVTDASGSSVTSRTAMMSVSGMVAVTRQPADFAGKAGSSVTFTVAASRKNVTYQWQISEDGVNWRNSSTKTATYAVTLSEKNNGRRVRCVITDAEGHTAVSDTAMMSVKGLLTITAQPADYSGAEGSQAVFGIAASQKGASFQWQLSDDGETWCNSSTTSATYTSTLTADNNGRRVRCIVTDSSGSVTSQTVRMVIQGRIAVTKQPTDVTGDPGSAAAFTVDAAGIGLSYQWQLSDDDGATWRNSSTTSARYAATLSEKNHNRLVRCVVTDKEGRSVTSRAARMKLNAVFRIMSQPSDYVGAAGDRMSFTVEAEGYRLAYQWQLSDDNGSNWRNSSTKEAAYTTTLSQTNNRRLVRCVVTDINGTTAVSGAARMSIREPITITTQPESYAAIPGEQVEFRVVATGDNTLSYVWQLSDDNGFSWRDSSVTTASYWVTASSGVDGRRFRCVVRDDKGNELISGAAALRVTDSVTPGFITRYGVKKYRYADGSYANGLTDIDGKWYYFVSQALRTGIYSIDDALCYFDDETGAAISGLKYVESHGKYYWFQGVDGVVKGFHRSADGIRYFHPSSGTMQTGLRTVDGKYYCFDKATGLMQTGWYHNPEDGKSYYFLGMEGAAKGLTEIDGEIYYFNDYYVAKTGGYTFDGSFYYFDEYSCAAKRGFYTTDYGDTYYFDDSGRAVSGWQNIDGDNYYFLSDYTMSRGLTSIGGKRYYFGFDTGAAIRTNSLVWIGMNQLMYIKAEGGYFTGLTAVDGALYDFASENGVALSGMREIDGSKYCFAEGSYEALTGFVDYNGARYYFGSDGKMLTGMQTLDDGSGTRHTYYFDASGVMQTGRVILDDGSIYCFDENGRAYAGWYTYVNGARYYFDPATHQAVTGWQYIDQSKATFFFESNGTLKTGLIRDSENKLYAFDADGEPVKGWHVDSGDTYYFDLSTGQAVTGLVAIDGKRYLFAGSYKRMTGYQNIGGTYYYFDPVTGAAKSGFIHALTDSGTAVYYGDSSGALVTGLQTIGGNLYCFNSAGVMRSGVYVADDGSSYYFDPVTGQAVTGFVTNGSNINYYDADGRMYTGTAGIVEIDGKRYYFDRYGARKGSSFTVDGGLHIFDADTGAEMTGVVINPRSGYLTAVTGSGEVVNNTYRYAGAEYFAGDAGVLRTSTTKTVDGVMCYYDENGERQFGLLTYTSKGTTYTFYFDDGETVMGGKELTAIQNELNSALSSDGWHTVRSRRYYVRNGAFAKGIVTVGGIRYGFSEMSGVRLSGLRRIGGKTYYLDPNGVVTTGFVIMDGDLRYFDESTGEMVTGVRQIDGKTYCFLSNGVMVTGDVYINGKWYYGYQTDEAVRPDLSLNTDGSRKTNCWAKASEGFQVYLDTHGNRVAAPAAVNGSLYCFDADGAPLTTFQRINGGTAYFDENGAMVTGLRDIGGKRYYFDVRTGLRQTGFVRIDGKVCYFDQNGVMQRNGFFSIGSRRYYADADGAIATGLVTIGGKQYYFLSSGEQKFGKVYVGERACYFDPATGERKTGFVTYGGRRYYYDDSAKGFPQGKVTIDSKTYLFISGDGSVYTGYCRYEDKEYYLDETTGESLTGIFAKPNGNVHYFLGDGTLARGLQTIGGKQYYFYPANGVKVDGLQSIGSKLYYFHPTKGMLTAQTVTVDGLSFSLADDGSATVLGDSDEAKLLRAGMEYLGRPYKSEVAGEDDILSCSGFVRQMYKAIGVDLAGSSYRQYFNLARKNPTVDSILYASPGDLVFYVSLDCGHGDQCGFLGEIHHVAMYVGGGKIIEANRNDAYPELSCIILQNYADSTTYFPYKIVSVTD